MKKILTAVMVYILIFSLSACTGNNVDSMDTSWASQSALGSEGETVSVMDTDKNSTVPDNAISVEVDHDDLDSTTNSSDISFITLEGQSITFEGSGATVAGNAITITSAGTYSISGKLDDGQIIVDSQDQETVRLILNGVDIACSSSSPIYVLNSEKTVLTLADGMDNAVTDGASYQLEDTQSDDPNAAVFSKDSLTINGSGSLTVNANYNNGIVSKDDLLITGGNINVTSVNDGIKGRDSIAVMDGVITINAGGDGMQSNNDEDPEKGYIYIEGGTFIITAGADGIQAETKLLVSGGNITIVSGGGSINSSIGYNREAWGMGNNTNGTASDTSTKGMKAGVDLTITGGTFDIDSLDDTLHSNDTLVIGGGNLILATGDDGIHSDSTLEIDGGGISIAKCYEGLESAVIIINDGSIHITSSDDGINVVSAAGSSFVGGRGGQENFSVSSDNYLTINGGYIVSDAGGDGLDINGSTRMTGGIVLVNGPTSNNNGALDSGNFEISGGFLVAVGSAGMAQAPGTSSSQYSVIVNFQNTLAGGTVVHIETEDGEEVLTFVPTKAYQSVVLSSPELEKGETYVVYTGGSSTGIIKDGLYSGGTYTAGNEFGSLTISSAVTAMGSFGGGFQGRPGADRGIPGGQRP